MLKMIKISLILLISLVTTVVSDEKMLKDYYDNVMSAGCESAEKSDSVKMEGIKKCIAEVLKPLVPDFLTKHEECIEKVGGAGKSFKDQFVAIFKPENLEKVRIRIYIKLS